eukprot:6883651-Prymnesium_polylepis.1
MGSSGAGPSGNAGRAGWGEWRQPGGGDDDAALEAGVECEQREEARGAGRTTEGRRGAKREEKGQGKGGEGGRVVPW